MTNILNHYQTISERQFKSSTGLSRAEFSALSIDFELMFIEVYGLTYESYLANRVTEQVKLPTLESCLFFVLFQYKNDLVFDSLGLIFQMGCSTAHDNYKKYSALLEQTLKKKRSIQKENLKV